MPATLQDALLHHQAGELTRAAQLYREILTSDPRHADAYHLLGVLMHQLQHSQVAVELIGNAIQINSNLAPYHNNLGNALVALGKREDARASFARSIRLSRNAGTYINLATLDLGDGRIAESKAGFKTALRLSPESVESLVGLGRIAMIEGQTSYAMQWFEKALSVDPGCGPALNGLGDLKLQEECLQEAEQYYARAAASVPADVDAQLKLGHLYMRLEQYASASMSYGNAFQLCPQSHSTAILLGMANLLNENAEAAKEIALRALQLDELHPASHHLLGSALVLGRDYKGALVSFNRSLSLDREQHEAMNGMGNAYDGLGDYVSAACAFQAALVLQPQNPIYLQNVGLNLARRGDGRAISFLEQAIALAPNDATAHIRLAESLLLFGDYNSGFAEYEWRWRSPSFSKPHRRYNEPLWDGTSLSGKTILVHAEQGLGDTIQFVRFLPQIASLGGKIILVVQKRLLRLLKFLDSVDACLHQDEPLPAFDLQCPLLSLPRLLGTELPTIPEPINLGVVVAIGQPQRLDGALRVGLAWAGNPQHLRDSLRSLPLASLFPLRDVANCRYVRLQKNVPEADEVALRAFEMDDPDDLGRDLLDTAHAMKDLDLILSVDTAVAHLAATLGKTVWLILQEAADWRWGTAGATTPWYPTMKLFRKQPGETSAQLVERLAGALRKL